MTTQHRYLTHAPGTAITAVQHGETMTRGTGFEALSFIHRQLDGLMDPLIMVDHFTMRVDGLGGLARKMLAGGIGEAA